MSAMACSQPMPGFQLSRFGSTGISDLASLAAGRYAVGRTGRREPCSPRRRGLDEDRPASARPAPRHRLDLVLRFLQEATPIEEWRSSGEKYPMARYLQLAKYTPQACAAVFDS